MKDLGRFLRALRKDSNLTQKDVAEHLGLSFQMVHNFECGICTPPLNLVKKLCNIYNADLAIVSDRIIEAVINKKKEFIKKKINSAKS